MPKTLVATKSSPVADDVTFIRDELSEMDSQYQLIRDCIEGSIAIKRSGTVYLPMPNGHDQSIENRERYAAYGKRAVFYNVTARTLSGLSGQVFAVDPVIKVPTLLDPVVKDANGSGVTLIQQSNEVEEDVIAYGRAGLFVDFPSRDDSNTPITRAEQENGEIRPNIINYKPWNIINWRTTKRGAKHYLSLVVLREKYDDETDEFRTEEKEQYRVLTLENNVYRQRLYRDDGNGMVIVSDITPTDWRGVVLNFIPFTFIGAINNDIHIDAPPLFDLADLNVAHYRNSADYEDSVYLVGQPTPVAVGLTKDWVKDVLKGRVELGSRGVIPLPAGANFQIVQASPNSMAKEAMEMKERQMVALGAKLVEQKTVQRTATEADLEAASETSVLASITNNVSASYKFSLECCSIFAGSTTVAQDAKNDEIVYELNTDFALSTASNDDIRATIEAWQKEAITFSEMRAKLRRSGTAILDDEKARAEIKQDAETMELTTPFDNEDDGENNNDE